MSVPLKTRVLLADDHAIVRRGLRLILETELPDLQQALLDAGASRFDMVNPLPPFFADQSPRPIDDKLWTYTARRPAGEWVFADAARREPRVTVRRGVQAAGLITGASALAGTPCRNRRRKPRRRARSSRSPRRPRARRRSRSPGRRSARRPPSSSSSACSRASIPGASRSLRSTIEPAEFTAAHV